MLDSLQSEGGGWGYLRPKGRHRLEFRWLANAAKQVLGQIKQPTLIFHAREDDQSDISNAFLLQSGLVA